MAQSAAAEQIVELPYRRAMRPIDLVHLAKQCLGDEHLEYEILRLFDTTVQTYFARLEQATSFDDLIMSLHSIKGAASGVGAFTVSDLARACEAELQAARPLHPERIADLGMAIEEVRTFIARMLSNEPA
jgi:HPt (histidine-containing phosphotransfer) domain-containing protein